LPTVATARGWQSHPVLPRTPGKSEPRACSPSHTWGNCESPLLSPRSSRTSVRPGDSPRRNCHKPARQTYPGPSRRPPPAFLVFRPSLATRLPPGTVSRAISGESAGALMHAVKRTVRRLPPRSTPHSANPNPELEVKPIARPGGVRPGMRRIFNIEPLMIASPTIRTLRWQSRNTPALCRNQP
jgi:hypothetical protein